MLSSHELTDWFFNRDIVPGQADIISHQEYVSLMFDSYASGKVFNDFVKDVVVPTGHLEYIFVEDSWENLHNTYIAFVSNYNKPKTTQ